MTCVRGGDGGRVTGGGEVTVRGDGVFFIGRGRDSVGDEGFGSEYAVECVCCVCMCCVCEVVL